MLGKGNFFHKLELQLLVNLEKKISLFLVFGEEDYQIHCYWTSRSQVSTVSFSRRKEYSVNTFENFMWKYAVHWYGDFLGAVFVNILNLTKWQNESLRFFVVLLEIMTKRILPKQFAFTKNSVSACNSKPLVAVVTVRGTVPIRISEGVIDVFNL